MWLYGKKSLIFLTKYRFNRYLSEFIESKLEIYLFKLEIYLFKLETYLFKLETYLFKLEIYLFKLEIYLLKLNLLECDNSVFSYEAFCEVGTTPRRFGGGSSYHGFDVSDKPDHFFRTSDKCVEKI